MIELVSQEIPAPTVDDLKVGPGGTVHVTAGHPHPITWCKSIGVVACGLEGGFVWACTLTGNGGRLDTITDALTALLDEALTEYPYQDGRLHP